MTSLFAGFALGLSLILAIGAQNSFVLRQGLKGEFVLPVVLTCAISDAVLIVAGVAGFGALVDNHWCGLDQSAKTRHAGNDQNGIRNSAGQNNG